MTANATVALTIRLKDAVSAPARGVKNAFRQIGSDFAKLRSGFDLAGKISFAATAVNQLGTQARGVLTSVLGPAMQFEEAITRAGALTNEITRKEMADLTAAARQMGRETRYTSIEAAQGLGQLAIAGYKAKEQIGALPIVLKLTQASGVEMGRTADILTDITGAFNKKAFETGDVAGMLAAVFSSSTTTLETLYETMKYGASVATQLKIPMNDVGVLVGLLGNAGIKGSMAGTALNNSLLTMVDVTPKGRKALASIGVDAKKLSEHLNEPVWILNELNRAFQQKGFTDPEKLRALYRIFQKRGVPSISILLNEMNKVGKDGESAFERLTKAVGGGQTKLNQIARTMDTTALASVRRFQSAVESLKIDIAEKLGPSLNPLIEDIIKLVNQFAGWARKNPELVATIGKVLIGVAGFAAVFGPLLLTISSLISSFTLLRGALALIKMPFRIFSGINKELAVSMSKNAGAAKALSGSLRGLSATIGTVGAAFAGWEVGKMLDSLIGKVFKLRGELLSTEMGLSLGESKGFNQYIKQLGETYGIDTLKDIAEGNIERNVAGPATTQRGILQRGITKEDLQAIADRPVNVTGKVEMELNDRRVQVKKISKLKNGPDLVAGANF